MSDTGLRQVIERAAALGRSPLRAVREHLGLSRDALARAVRLDPRCLAVCEDYDGIAVPDARARVALERSLGVPAGLLFETRRRAA